MLSLQPKLHKRYRVLNGKPSIELKLRNPRQLFDERDPAPFRDRDLDDDAARYIVQSFKDLKEQRDVKLSIYIESLGDFEDRPRVIEAAIHAFFRFESDAKRRELRDIFRIGFTALAIGLTFLFTCTYFAHGLPERPSGLLGKMMQEGLMIMGWVSMWKPISIFLYEWWPIRESLKIYRKLSTVEVEILPMSTTEPIRKPTVDREVAGGNLAAVRDWKTPSTV